MRKIAGRRVYLAPLDLNDAERYVEWLNDFEITAFLYAYHQIITRENELEWLRNAALKGEPQFGIRLADDDRLIGNCGLININHMVGKAEMGIFIGDRKSRGQGLGEEAVRLLRDRFRDIIAPGKAGPRNVPPAASGVGPGSLDKKGVL